MLGAVQLTKILLPERPVTLKFSGLGTLLLRVGSASGMLVIMGDAVVMGETVGCVGGCVGVEEGCMDGVAGGCCSTGFGLVMESDVAVGIAVGVAGLVLIGLA